MLNEEEKKGKEGLTFLPEDTMFTLALNGLNKYLNNNEKELSQQYTKQLLNMLMPGTVQNDQRSAKIMFILLVAQVLQLMEVEAESLQKMRDCSDEDCFKIACKMDYGSYKHTTDNINIIMNTAAKFAFDAGWRNKY